MKSIQDILKNNMENLTLEEIKNDIKLSQEGKYNTKSEVTDQSVLDFKLPNILHPFSFMNVETGVAVVSGFGTVTVPFKKSFQSTPSLLNANFGFISIRIPWVNFSWDKYTIGWVHISIPIPHFESLTIHLPSMAFMMNVNNSGFQILNIIGKTYISYLAIGSD